MDFRPDKAALWRAIWKGLDGDPTDDALCLLAVEAIEPLIDLYWVDVVDEFEAAVVQDTRLRKPFPAVTSIPTFHPMCGRGCTAMRPRTTSVTSLRPASTRVVVSIAADRSDGER